MWKGLQSDMQCGTCLSSEHLEDRTDAWMGINFHTCFDVSYWYRARDTAVTVDGKFVHCGCGHRRAALTWQLGYVKCTELLAQLQEHVERPGIACKAERRGSCERANPGISVIDTATLLTALV